MATSMGCPSCGVLTVCGVGDWAGPQAGDPSANATLSARAVFNGIRVSWTWPTTNAHAVAHVQLYRNGVNDVASAQQLAIVANNFYFDEIVDRVEGWYYWIQIVSIHGTVSAPIGPAYAESVASSAEIAEMLTGQIREGHLATTLRENWSKLSHLDPDAAAKITALQDNNMTLAQAITDAQNGVDGTYAFITSIQNTGVRDKQSIVEQINLLAQKYDSQYSLITTTARATYDELSGKMTGFWGAKIETSGLVGGFGMANDGQIVEAGFNVDRFWIGRSGTDKILPFIIDQGVVYLNNAVIQTAAIRTANIRDGAITNAKIGSAQVDTLQVAGNAITANYYAQGNSVAVLAGTNQNVLRVTVNMGPTIANSGVMIHGHIVISPGGDTTVGMQLVRGRDNVVLRDIRSSSRGGFVNGMSIFAYDPAPQVWANDYWLRVYNPASGPGGNVGFTVTEPTLMATGAKR